jgi:cellulose synthase operon protein C
MSLTRTTMLALAAALVSAAALTPNSSAAQEYWIGGSPASSTTTGAVSLRTPQAIARPDLQRPGAASIALPTPPAGRAATAPIDESALRYYASQNDSARVASEIRRIRLLHPDWTPPDDLFEEVPDSAEEQQLWALYAEGRLEAISAAIDEIRGRNPNWRPSQELITKTELAQARNDIIQASDRGDYSEVVTLVEARPTLMTCVEMDLLWRTAEALVKTEAQDRAFDLYRFILTRCPDPQERLATIQKASVLLNPSTTEKLLALGLKGGDRSGFENARADLFRRRLGEAINGGADVNAAELKSFETMVDQRRLVDDALLLGWLRYSRKDWGGAINWFKLATSWGNPPKAIEGTVLALREQGQLAEAENLSYQNRKGDPLIAKLYVEILATELTRESTKVVDSARLARLEEVVLDSKSVIGSQALGWYLYRAGSTQNAHRWFKASAEWEPIEANVLGLALSLHRMKNAAAFKAIVAEYRDRFPAVAALKRIDVATAVRRASRAPAAPPVRSQLADEAVALFKSGKYQDAITTLDKRAATVREDENLALLRGWSLYHTGQYEKARAHFEGMDAQRSTQDTQYGKFYSNERLIPPQFRAE